MGFSLLARPSTARIAPVRSEYVNQALCWVLTNSVVPSGDGASPQHDSFGGDGLAGAILDIERVTATLWAWTIAREKQPSAVRIPIDALEALQVQRAVFPGARRE